MVAGSTKAIGILLGDKHLSRQDLQVIETLVFANGISDHEEQVVIEKAVLEHVTAEDPLDRIKLNLMYDSGFSQAGWQWDEKTGKNIERWQHTSVLFEDYQKNSAAARQLLDTCVNNVDWNKLWFLNIIDYKTDGSFLAWAVFNMCSCEKIGDVWQCLAGAEQVNTPHETTQKCHYLYRRIVKPSDGTCVAYDPLDEGHAECEKKLQR